MSSTIVQTQTWIDEYTDWACKCSPLTPPHFHRNIALTLACANIARRVHLQLPHEKLYPNIYTLIVAITTVHAKTTAFNLARRIAYKAMPDKIITSISTPEAFTDQLAGVKPANFNKISEDKQKQWESSALWGARRLFILDEAGRFFNAMRRDYNTTLDAMLMELYDSNDEPIIRETRKDGITEISNPSLSCLFATTPANIKILLNNKDSWSDGFWNRWNFVSVDQPMVWKIGETSNELPNEVIETLRHVSDELGDRDYSASVGRQVIDRFYDYTRQMRELLAIEQDEKLHGVHSRLPTKRMKAAICLATLDNPKRPKIELHHWNATEEFAIGWQRDAILAIEASKRSDKTDLESRLWSLLVEHMHEGITARRMQQIVNRTADEIAPVLDKWIRMGSICKKEKGKTSVFIPNEK